MADELTTNQTNLMYEMRGQFVRNYVRRAVFYSELMGVRKLDGEQVYNDRGRPTAQSPKGRGSFNGKWVRIPIELGPRQGTGTTAESGTVNTPHTSNLTEAHITITRMFHPVSLSLDTEYATDGPEYDSTFANAIQFLMEGAETVMPRVANEMLLGNGDALLSSFTAGATSATQTIGTAANFYQHYPTRIVDVLTRSTGTAVTNGAGRTIVSNNPAAGTVTFDLSLTVTTNEGIYIEGSYGTAYQGLGQLNSATGTFEAIDRAATPGWQGVSSSLSSGADLSDAILDDGDYQVGGNADGLDFYLGDPKVIDKYVQSKAAQVIWPAPPAKLETGWEGVAYRGKPLIGDRDMKLGRLVGLDMSAPRLYSYAKFVDGPNWVNDTGAQWMRFSRKPTKEAWLADFAQLGFRRTNSIIFFDGLNRA